MVVANPDGQSAKLANGYIYSAAEPNMGLGVPYGDPNSATVAAGQTATYTLSIGGEGMSGTASLSCTGVPAGPTVLCLRPWPLMRRHPQPSPSRYYHGAHHRSPSPACFRAGVFPASIVVVDALSGDVVCARSTPAQALPRRWPRYLWLAPLGLLLLTISCGGGGGVGNSPQPQQSGTPAGTTA